jgi:hypothetical protein
MTSNERSEGWPPVEVKCSAAKVLPQEVSKGTASHTLTIACDGVCHAAAARRPAPPAPRSPVFRKAVIRRIIEIAFWFSVLRLESAAEAQIC